MGSCVSTDPASTASKMVMADSGYDERFYELTAIVYRLANRMMGSREATPDASMVPVGACG